MRRRMTGRERTPTREVVVVWLLALLFCSTPYGPGDVLLAQESPNPAPRGASSPAFQEAPQSLPQEWEEGEYVEAPRRVVAQLIREALRSPDNQKAWSELARALPELGEKEEGESYVRLLQAARIADSVAVASAPASGSSQGKGRDLASRAGGLGAVLASLPAGLRGPADRIVVWITANDLPLVLFLTGFLILLILLKGQEGAGRRPAEGGERVEDRGEYLLREGTSRGLEMARALWSSGVPVHEIARRTGLAQDALSVMLSLQRRSEG